MEPITRSEQYLASILGEDVVLPIPQSRIEYYLNAIAQNGIAPSSAGLINYDPDANYPDGSIGKEMHTLDGDVSDLKSEINEFNRNMTFSADDWEIGTLVVDGRTVKEQSSTTRIRSDFIEVNEGTVLTVGGNSDCLYVYEFGDAKNYFRQNAGGAFASTITTGKYTRYVRILLRKSSSNPTITSDDIAEQVARLSGELAVKQPIWLVDELSNETYEKAVVDADSAEQAVLNGYINQDLSFHWIGQLYITNTGVIAYSAGMFYSQAIRIPTGAKSFIYTYTKTSKAAEFRWIQLNADREYISGTYHNTSTSGTVEVAIDENAKFLSFSIGNWSTAYTQEEVVSAISIKYPTAISDMMNGSILQRCEEQISNVFTGADAYRAREATSGTAKKNFALLMLSDTHGDAARVSNAIKLLNSCGAIDGAIHLGDAHNSNYNDGSIAKTLAEMNKATKPFLAVMGNHDGRQKNTTNCTVEQAVSAYLGNLTLASVYEERGYGYYDFDAYKIRIIMLNAYDFPNDKSGDNWVYYGDDNMYRQTQITWFVSTLSSTPEDYTVIVAEHYIEPTTLDQTTIPQHVGTANVTGLSATRGKTGQMSGTVISDIINAFVGKTTLSQTYTYTTPGEETGVTVSADFSSRSAANFACYIVGHVHCQAVGHITNHDTQVVYLNDTSCLYSNNGSTNMWPTYWSLIPRAKGQKSEDLLTVLCVDTANKKINFVRVGADRTMFGEDYSIVNYDY